LSVKQDPRLESRFSGAWLPPVTLAERDGWLASAGLNRHWGDALQDAMHALQYCHQKIGLESARLDPACGGYSFWTIVDVYIRPGKEAFAQGLFNVFWEEKKNGATAESFRVFNGPTVLMLMADPEARIAVSGDAMNFAFWISHYGDARLENPRLGWTMKAGDQTLIQGEHECGNIELGSTQKLSEFSITIPDIAKPIHAVLDVELNDGTVKNAWDIWLFPKREKQDGTGIAVSPLLMAAL